MQRLKIGGRRYAMPTHWEDITLAQCAWLWHRAKQTPAVLAYYESLADEENAPPPTNAEVEKFVSDAIACLAKIPPRLVRHDELMVLGATVLPRFVLGVAGRVDYAARGIASFRLGGERYWMPRSGCDVAGNSVPMNEVTAIELCSLSDIVAAGDITLAPLALSVACRKRGERYAERVAMERRKRFARAPASLYWELWTLLAQAHEYLQREYPNCYPKGGGESQGGESVSWSDTLVALAADKPSELDYLQQMNGYDFMHLLSENIKRETEKWKMNAALMSCGLI